jgi:hypothetical protein
MNPFFFFNSNLLFNDVEAAFREHDRMFRMMHERMHQMPYHSHPIHHIDRTVRSEKRIQPRHETLQPVVIPKLGSSIDKYESIGKTSNRTSVHTPRSKSASRAGAKRQDTLAREGIKPSITNSPSGKGSTLPKVAKPNSGKYSDDNPPATEALVLKESLGYGWYQITKLDTGQFHVHGNQIQLESTHNASLICVQEPKLRQTRKACYHTVTPYYQVSFQIKQTTELQNMINIVIGYKNDHDYLVASIDLLQKTVTLYACTQLVTTLEQLLTCPVIISNSFHDIAIHTQQFLQSFSRNYHVQIQIENSTLQILVNELVLLSLPSVIVSNGNEKRKTVDGLPGLLCINRSKNIIKDWKVTSLLVDNTTNDEETITIMPISSSVNNAKGGGTGMYGNYQSSIPLIQQKPMQPSSTTTVSIPRPVASSTSLRPNAANSSEISSTATITVHQQNSPATSSSLLNQQDIPSLPYHTINHTLIQQQL